jgi:hypothetical protein
MFWKRSQKLISGRKLKYEKNSWSNENLFKFIKWNPRLIFEIVSIRNSHSLKSSKKIE